MIDVKKKSKIKKIIAFSPIFEPDDDFKEYFKSLGYSCFIIDKFKMMHDQRIVEYVENNSVKLLGRNVLKGKKDYNYRIGFCGTASVLEVDTSRTWKIKYNNMDFPYVKYCSINVDKYGEIIVIEEEE